MPNWTQEAAISEPAAAPGITTEQDLAATKLDHEMLREAYADLENLYRDNVGWQQIGQQSGLFTPEGRTRIAAIADLTATGNALIKRGIALRTGYIWGKGVTVSIRDDGSTGQDVNAVWDAFWDEPSNRKEFTSSEAQTRYERRLATGGEAFWALPTDPLTGRVRIRRIPPSQITERITDPEDEGTVWFYRRVWSAATITDTGQRGSQPRDELHPALGFSPAQRPKTFGGRGGDSGKPIRWDAPVRPVTVNVADEDWRGIGDVLAAMPWARMDKEFLEDLSVYMRALTRILGQVTAKNPRMAAAVSTALQAAPAGGGPAAGQWATTDPNTSLSLVSKSGAQIDADSHRPFATMTAAALEVPLTMLLGDPGVSGARAVAETLDQPTELMAHLRRNVHTELFRDIADYVIDRAVVAPRGALRGTVARDGNRLVVSMPEGDDRQVVVTWPEFDSTSLVELVAAIADADATGKLPPLETFKLLANALGIDDADDLIDALTDDEGNWVGFPATPVPDVNPPLA